MEEENINDQKIENLNNNDDSNFIPEKVKSDNQSQNDFLNMLDKELTAVAPDSNIPIKETKDNANTDEFSESKLSNEFLIVIWNYLGPVDFNLLAGLKPTEKMTERHYVVITVDLIEKAAKKHNVSLGVYHGKVYIFNKQYWTVVEDVLLKMFLGWCAEKLGVEVHLARYFKFRRALYIQFVEKVVLLKPNLQGTTLVNFKNGTLEIVNGVPKFREHRMSDLLRYVLPFDFDPGAEAKMFLRFLDEVLPQKEFQNALSEYFGSIFINPSVLKLEKALYMYGQGSNGKSVIHYLVAQTLGEANVSSYTMNCLMSQNSYYLPLLSNKLLNYSSELNGDINADLFKQIVSGEPLSVRMIYGAPFTMTDYAKIAFNCNHLPREVEYTNAFFRRFLIVPFNVIIPEEKQDRRLPQKIVEAGELPGIFNWFLAGLKRVIEQGGYSESDLVRQEVATYKAESDNVQTFLAELHYEVNYEHYIAVNFLFKEYQAFCRDFGFRPLSYSNFLRRLRALNLPIEKRNVGQVIFMHRNPPYAEKEAGIVPKPKIDFDDV